MATKRATKSSGVTATELGAHLDMTRQRVRQLDREGVFKRLASGGYDQAAARIAYIQWLRDEERRAVKGAATARLNDARAAEIERRLAREDRSLVDIEEAIGFVDEVLGTLKSELQGVAARITRDVALRRQIEAEIDAVLSRAADHFKKEAAALRAGCDKT